MKTIADVLKVSCKEAHIKTEKTLINKLKAINNLDDYIAILRMFYGYFSPLEDQIEEQVTADVLPDIAKRKRSTFILADLEKLQYEKPIALAEDLPFVGNYQQAAGVMYVLEGSTLGGQYIAQMLLSKPALKDHTDAMAFFQGYKQENFYMWEVFKDHLQAHVESKEDADVVVQSAIDTFALMDEWISKN